MPRKSGSMTKEEQRAMLREIASEAPESMRLLRFTVKDVQMIKFADIVPKGDVIVVGGKNAQGKSSLLKAIAYLFCGIDALPTDVIRMGQQTATITGQVGPFMVRRYFDRKYNPKSGRYCMTKVRVWQADGSELPQRQHFLNLLLNYLTFDPMEFLQMKPIEQFETMRKVAKIDLNLEAHDAAHDADYKLRHDKRVEWNALLARLEALPEVPEGASGVTQGDVQRLTEALQGAVEHNGMVQRQQAERDRLEQTAAQELRQAANLRAEAQKLLDAATNLDGKMSAIAVDDIPTCACSAKHFLEAASKILVAAPIDTVKLGEVLRESQAALAANAKAGQRAEVAREVAAAEAEWTALDERVKANREERARAMREAVLPVKYLVMGDGELFYKGVPFDQASGSERIRVSLEIGMAANPKVKILRFLDGGWDMLDEDSQQLVRDEVVKHNYQLWVEHVGAGSGTTVVMTAGEAEGEDVA